MNATTTTKKSVLPYEFRAVGQAVTIFNTRGQRLKVTRNQIVDQLKREDLDTHRRRMYERALIEIDRKDKCTCLQYLLDNGPCPVHGG